MEIGYLALFGIIAALVGALSGSLLVVPFEHQGRFALTRQTGLAIALALAVPIAPGLFWGFGIYSEVQQWLGWLGIASLFSLGVAGAAFVSANSAPTRVLKQMDLAARAVPFAQKNFDEIDYDDDQIISMRDLDRALMQKAFSGPEPQELLHFMRRNIHAMGHDVGSYSTGGGQHSTTVTVSVINKGDIERYAAMMSTKYAAWRK